MRNTDFHHAVVTAALFAGLLVLLAVLR